MKPTVWVGGRIAAPLFVEDRGGYQADLVVWLDVTRDLVVGMQLFHPSEPDSIIADVLRQTLARPQAGPNQPPAQIRVSSADLAALVSPACGKVPVVVEPTPELERFVQVMGESMPGASPHLAEYRKLLHGNAPLVSRLLAASARFFEAGPWNLLWDSEILQLDVPKLSVRGWCVSVMGRGKLTWGLSLFRSAADFEALREIPDEHERSEPIDLGAEGLSLSFAATGELPALFRRELAELGWDLARLDVYPVWIHAAQDGTARLPTEEELRILLAAVAGVPEHVARFRRELEAAEVPTPRRSEHAVEADTGVLQARITSPHPEVPWQRGQPPRQKPRRPAKLRDKRGGKRPGRR